MITKEDIEYLQNKLGEMNEGKRHAWNLRDRALVSELLIDWQARHRTKVSHGETFTGANSSVSIHFVGLQ